MSIVVGLVKRALDPIFVVTAVIGRHRARAAMPTVALPLLAMACAGCSGSDSPDNDDAADTGACMRLAGSYQVTFTELSGDCGDIPPQIINLSSSATQEHVSECTGSTSVSDDGCTGDYDTTCPTSTGGSLREEGTVHLSIDGRTANATEQITLFDEFNGLVCSGTYRLAYAKL